MVTKIKSPWWKKQGKEILKVIPKTVVSAAVGAGVMVGASRLARPNQVNSGDDGANRENQALFIYYNSNSTGMNTFEIVVITALMKIMLSPIICMQCKWWTKWMKGCETAREIKKEEDDPIKVNQVIKKIQDAEDNKNTIDMINIREEVLQKLTKYNTKTTASLSSIKYSKDGANKEKACIKNGDSEEREEDMSKKNSSQ